MPDAPTRIFTQRENRYAVVRELVNKLVANPEDRLLLLNAVSDFGYAAACSGIDDVIASGRIPQTMSERSAIIDKAQERR